MGKFLDKLKNFVVGPDYDDEYDDYEDEYEDDYEDDYEELPPIRPYRSSRTVSSSSTRTSTQTRSSMSSRTLPPIRPVSSKSSLNLQQVTKSSTSRAGKVMNINTNINMQVLVAAPKSMEEAGELCKQLKERKTVIVNLENVEHDTAQRISDFLCGANYALDGTIQLISNEIFVICPIDVEISSQFKEAVRANALQITTY